MQHLIIKPMDTGLETSLIVTTDRRTYHLRLRSHRTEFMPRVAFIYPQDAMAKWDEIKKNDARNHSRQILPGTGEYLGDLNFDYTIDSAMPLGSRCAFITMASKHYQMPAAMSQSEAPILLVVRKDGGLFIDEESVQVNYRLQGNCYIVDSILDKTILSKAWIPARIASPYSGENKMRILFAAFLRACLGACAFQPLTRDNPFAALDEKIASDTVNQLARLYPPGRTQFSLVVSDPESFGALLADRLRTKGYALSEKAEAKIKNMPPDT